MPSKGSNNHYPPTVWCRPTRVPRMIAPCNIAKPSRTSGGHYVQQCGIAHHEFQRQTPLGTWQCPVVSPPPDNPLTVALPKIHCPVLCGGALDGFRCPLPLEVTKLPSTHPLPTAPIAWHHQLGVPLPSPPCTVIVPNIFNCPLPSAMCNKKTKVLLPIPPTTMIVYRRILGSHCHLQSSYVGNEEQIPNAHCRVVVYLRKLHTLILKLTKGVPISSTPRSSASH